MHDRNYLQAFSTHQLSLAISVLLCRTHTTHKLNTKFLEAQIVTHIFCTFRNKLYSKCLIVSLRFACRDKYICGLQSFTPPFQQQTRMAVHYTILCSLRLVGPIIYLSWRDFLKADKAHEILQQTAVFLWIFLRICSVDKKEWMMISNPRQWLRPYAIC